MSDVQTVSVDALNELLKQDGNTVIDVREAHEFEAFRVPGARLFPLSQFNPVQTMETLADASHPIDAPLYVLCLMGGRALQAAEALEAVGAKPIVVSGGTQAWADAGYELEAG